MWIPVKHFLNELLRALRRARHFALAEGSAIPTKGSLVIVSGQETRSDPCISSVTTSIMITTSNSSAKEERAAQSITRCSTAHIACSELARVRTELLHLLVIPSLAPHPVQPNGESSRHGNLGDLPAPAHHQVEILTAPFRQAAHGDLGCFHHQEAQHRTPLFSDMPQSSPIAARVLQRHQSQIARDLLATLKSFCSPAD